MTRFRLVADLGRMGFGYPQGFEPRFQRSHHAIMSDLTAGFLPAGSRALGMTRLTVRSQPRGKSSRSSVRLADRAGARPGSGVTRDRTRPVTSPPRDRATDPVESICPKERSPPAHGRG